VNEDNNVSSQAIYVQFAAISHAYKGCPSHFSKSKGHCVFDLKTVSHITYTVLAGT